MSEASQQINPGVLQAERLKLSAAEQAALHEQAIEAARSCGWLAGRRRSNRPRQIFYAATQRLARLRHDLYALRSDEPTDDLKWLYDNLRLIRTDVQGIRESLRHLSSLPLVRTSSENAIPRCIVLARALLSAAKYRITEPVFRYFVESVQEIEPLRLRELGGMLTAIKLCLLEVLAERGYAALEAFQEKGLEAQSYGIDRIITSLRFVGEIDWRPTLEALSVLHQTLQLDPARVYPRMDYESREMYRLRLSKLAAHSDLNEMQMARLAVKMAQEAVIEHDTPEPLRDRLRHVGYYIVDNIGSEEFLHRAGYHPGFGTAVQKLFCRFPDEIYIIGIEAITLITVVALIMSLVRTNGGLGLFIGALLLILPATQAAVELMNYLVTSVLTPHPLAKLDFSKAVDPSCATIVAIPTLLINEKQIRQLVDDLEIRYLVNRDPNIFYALLTDLPDTAEPAIEQDRRVDLATRLIEELNKKYMGQPYGGFYLFHRHRVFNPREGAYMGWERKRGKLLDLNQLLRHTYDPFPVKAGDMARLPYIRYVLTLDSDTQLPRGSAQKLIGAMAHPLNRPIIDPEQNIVTRGYGILQPRVGISVQSASVSRLASIYSGQTGFDIYSRAISDVYQDLYGEGIFTGKGIYDVDALRQVLERRFPRNALLSHDLIEGAYARAGLASDIEVIDDYPSHYSAYNRRRHRWLRGDWQIVRWIFNKVPDESRRLVPNPISLISRWKIVDNLRRSLMEPATLALLVAGWFWLPGGPRFWTLVTLALLFVPIYFRLIFATIRALALRSSMTARDALNDFWTSHASILLNIAFLAHQALVALDAVVRTIVRSTISHRRLLEWETATEAELGIRKRTPVDVYLDWVPLLAIALGACLIWRRQAIPYALPFLLAWCFSKLLSNWLNSSPHAGRTPLSPSQTVFLHEVALCTWHYFAQFSNDANNWLIPDNVQLEPYRIADRISPTNLGLLLNSRQAALEFGYLTLSEFTSLTELTLNSVLKLPRHFGHLVNWYDNVTMKPLEPQFISSVDSGNLVASLISLKQGCLELISEPLIPKRALSGLSDYYRMLRGPAQDAQVARLLKRKDERTWLAELFTTSSTPGEQKRESEPKNVRWPDEFCARVLALREEVRRFLPWYLPEFEAVRKMVAPEFRPPEKPLTLATAQDFYQAAETHLRELSTHAALPQDIIGLVQKLCNEVRDSRDRAISLCARLNQIVSECEQLIRDMKFSMLTDKGRNLLSVGYDVNAQELAKSCYDLLASEARTATFLAVAKDEAIQDTWFKLGRQHTVCEKEKTLISWTGTMFEYLMPVIWMRSHPETLLDRAVESAVRAQQAYGKNRNVPWGISEAAYSATDQAGNYQYAAFGVPCLALNVARSGSLVISPYSSCLALMVNAQESVKNLIEMARKKWLTDFGFYESADYTASPRRRVFARKYVLVRCWMAHHQGMSLAAICNVLFDSPFQRWFHAERMVQASELILQERPLRVKPITDTQPRRVLPFGAKTRAAKVRQAG